MVVTAAGDIVRASESNHAALFWGIRGGGGNFGIVTEFEVELHEVGPRVVGGAVVYPFDEAGDLLRFHREFTAAAPDPLCCYASIRTAPAVEFIPKAFHGERIATAYLCYSGALEDADEVIEPRRSHGEPIVDAIEPRPYTELQQLFDGVYPPGFRNYWTSRFVGRAGLTDDAIDTILHFARTITSPYSSIVVEHLGGAIDRVAPPPRLPHSHTVTPGTRFISSPGGSRPMRTRDSSTGPPSFSIRSPPPWTTGHMLTSSPTRRPIPSGPHSAITSIGSSG